MVIDWSEQSDFKCGGFFFFFFFFSESAEAEPYRRWGPPVCRCRWRAACLLRRRRTYRRRSADLSHEFILAEEEISDVSLATFYVFDKESSGTFRPGVQLVRGGGCGGWWLRRWWL